ncbi:hypothetical protein [[Mycobacterium] burgundiense]|uniref:Uncharacterized protein n=1 Tax=[Mycobacterium] burgundiense TaxID=3064286 RepID=A0ABM9LPJ1_9MYCO|nr:hypothetical protein [Mycolicibacterium sp. MU0053]CAJ1502525.1 hypothetical protein MU0053_002204 [Mycolicibacterium sp. MU0053]
MPDDREGPQDAVPGLQQPPRGVAEDGRQPQQDGRGHDPGDQQ